VSTKTTQEAPEVMLSTFSVNSIPTTILFYYGASHSFISQAFVRLHGMTLCVMKEPILVSSLGGGMQATLWCPSASISLMGVDFKVSPVMLRMASIDIILGMDWMKQHLVVIQC
jgi:hypothetical protein